MAARASRHWRSIARGAALSLAIHVGFLVVFLATLKNARAPSGSPPVEVSLVPPTPAPMRRPSPHPPTRSGAGATAAAPAAQAASTAAPVAPLALAGSDEGQDKLRALLRGVVGCSEGSLVKLTEAEKANCRRRLMAHVDPNLEIPAPIAPEKRAWFDASLASRHSGGHPPAFVCGVLIDGVRLVKPKRPPHSLKLGPCYIVPPNGLLTDEVDVEAPSRHDSVGSFISHPRPGADPGPGGFAPPG